MSFFLVDFDIHLLLVGVGILLGALDARLLLVIIVAHLNGFSLLLLSFVLSLLLLLFIFSFLLLLILPLVFFFATLGGSSF